MASLTTAIVLADEALGQAATVAQPLNLSDTEMRVHEGSVLRPTSKGVLRLESGQVLIYPTSETHLETPHGSAVISRRCAVLVSAEPHLTRFFVLSQPWSGNVKVYTDKHFRLIRAGGELDVVAAAASEHAISAVVHDGIRRRHMKVLDVGNHLYVATTEYSIPDAIVKQPLLSALKDSEEKGQRDLFNQILKVAAAISVSGSPEPYATHD